MKKRLLVLALGMVMIFSLSACGKSADSKAETEATSENADAGETSEAEAEKDVEEEDIEEEDTEEEDDAVTSQSAEEVVNDYAYDEELDVLMADGATDADITEFLYGSDWEVCGYDEGNGIQDIDEASEEVYDKFSYEILFDDDDTVTVENQNGDSYEGTFSVKGSQIDLKLGDKSAVITVEKGIATMDLDGVKMPLVRFSDFSSATAID